MTDPREPFDTDGAVDVDTATDLDDARMDVRGSSDLETGAGETGAAEGSSDTADLGAGIAIADGETADEAPEIEGGDPQSLVTGKS